MLEDAGLSMLALASILLRWRRTIIALGLFGAAVGLLAGLLSTRMYSSTATFIPEGSEGASSGFALAASQFGVRFPSSSGGAWGPPVYVELLRSRSLLEPMVRESVLVAEAGRVAYRSSTSSALRPLHASGLPKLVSMRSGRSSQRAR